jgi:hypothetical protein
VTIPLGLGIGRVVFRAVNRVEMLFCAVIAAVAIAGVRQPVALVLTGLAALILLAQLTVVKPGLNRRSDHVLSGGETSERSRGHVSYIALEVAKVIVLIALGITLLRNAR